ncbi:MAG: LysR substrate-binding domain-containing protein [Spirosomaceae bacterium]|jgi:DNA-binding transcriptional LysR family regulator|nr:LysR substrate-binding domain-containing protein [Spirosomataceae bacterium]
MDIQQLKNFLVLCETLNFRKASEQINIVQPALSRQIQLLEEEVGALLFSRDKRNVSLTEAGHFFRNETDRILHELEKAINKTAQLHRGEAGEIWIGHASSAMQTVLPQFILKIKAIFPNIKTGLLEISNLEQIEMLLNRETDIGIGPNLLLPNTINYRVLYQENFAVLLPQNHPISADNFTDLSVFANEKFILPPLSVGSGYVETIYQICQQYGFRPDVAYESAHSSGVQRLVEAGLGISIEPISSVRGHNMDIKLIELAEIPQKAEMMLLWLRERESELKRFMDLI